MHPSATHMTPRTIRILFTVFGLVVLGVSLLNFVDVMILKVWSNDQCAWVPYKGADSAYVITDIVRGGVADRAGLRDGDVLLSIDGKRFHGSRQAMDLINRVHAGEQAVYRIRRGGAVMDVPVGIIKTFDVLYFAQFLLGLGFWIVGMFVVLARPEGRMQRRFGRFSLFSMLFFCLAGITINLSTDPLWKVVILVSAFVFARGFAPPVFIGFFMNFPVGRRLARSWPMYTVLFVCSVAAAFALYLNRGGVLPVLVTQSAYYTGYAMYIAGLVIFVHSYARRVPREDRVKLRHILYAVVIGSAAFVYTLVLNATYPLALFIDPYLYLPSLLIVGVPPAFGYAIIRHGLMDVQVIIKRSLSYGIVTAAIAAIYLTFIFGAGSLVGGIIGQEQNQVLALIAFVLVALLFEPLKQRVQEWVDRIFFRERYSYQSALLEFSRELPRLIHLDQILALMVQRISGTMHVDVISVSLCSDREGCSTVAQGIPDELSRFDQDPGGLAGHLRRTRAPQSFALPADEFDALPIDAADKEKLRRSGIVLSVPMLLQDALIGTINVGEKKSGALYSQDDIDLLSTVASQAAIAIENARLHRSEVERQRIEEELAIARRIQMGLLPKDTPAIRGLDMAGISRPALTVGGDYYDFLAIAPDRVLVVVADVSGKGIPAALYMSKLQGMIQIAASMYDSPRDILRHVNRLLYEGMERNAFITMILALFDTTRREVRICRAGHPLPIAGCNDHLGYLESRGIGLGLEQGVLFDAKLEEFVRPFHEGELFVFYSDGLTEMMDAERNEFGTERLLHLVQAGEDLDVRTLKHHIVEEVTAFRGTADQNDDLTLVVVRAT